MPSFFIELFAFDCTIDQNQIFDWKNHSIKAGGVGEILDRDDVVDDGRGVVGVEDSIVNVGFITSVSERLFL